MGSHSPVPYGPRRLAAPIGARSQPFATGGRAALSFCWSLVAPVECSGPCQKDVGDPCAAIANRVHTMERHAFYRVEIELNSGRCWRCRWRGRGLNGLQPPGGSGIVQAFPNGSAVSEWVRCRREARQTGGTAAGEPACTQSYCNNYRSIASASAPRHEQSRMTPTEQDQRHMNHQRASYTPPGSFLPGRCSHALSRMVSHIGPRESTAFV